VDESACSHAEDVLLPIVDVRIPLTSVSAATTHTTTNIVIDALIVVPVVGKEVARRLVEDILRPRVDARTPLQPQLQLPPLLLIMLKSSPVMRLWLLILVRLLLRVRMLPCDLSRLGFHPLQPHLHPPAPLLTPLVTIPVKRLT